MPVPGLHIRLLFIGKTQRYLDAFLSADNACGADPVRNGYGEVKSPSFCLKSDKYGFGGGFI